MVEVNVALAWLGVSVAFLAGFLVGIGYGVWMMKNVAKQIKELIGVER